MNVDFHSFEWHSWLNTILVSLVIPAIRYLHKIRYNELKHLTMQLDRIEEKLDRHLEAHAEGRYNASNHR